MKRKIIGFIISVLLINTIYLLPVSAYEEVLAQENNTIGENSIVLYADVIQIKYRTHNGVHQYRRWNRTKNCWVDPYWINL